jgi:two-component system response regulator VicR
MKKRILIIDDDSDILELLKIVFRDSGHEVIFSQTALDINHISVLHPDLILLDVRINGSPRKGAEICSELKRDVKTKELSVILCSGEHNLSQIARECNADMYLAKPYDTISLLSQVNRYLS